MVISQDYRKYLLSEWQVKKPPWYETYCNALGNIPIKIPMSKESEQKLSEQLNFIEYKINPSSIYTSSLLTFILFLVAGIGIIFFGISIIYSVIVVAAGAGFAYFVFIYPSIQVTNFRIKATSDLLLSILYMVVSLRITPNLENALLFAAINVKGPVGRDLKKRVWDLSVGNYKSAEDALENFENKWKQENDEFAEALDVIRTAQIRSEADRAKMYEEAINLMLDRNMDRMKSYASELGNPVAIINYLGITLPVLTIVLFPVLTIFLTTAIKPSLLVALYDVILPLVVYWLMMQTLQKRPISFGAVDISAHPDAHKLGHYRFGKTELPLLPFAILIGLAIGALGYFLIISTQDAISILKILGGIFVSWGIATPIIFYSYFSYRHNDKIRDDIISTEDEFAESLYELGLILSSGYSVESSVEKLLEKIRNLKISQLFSRAMENVKKFGFTLQKALFDKDVGVARYYPSDLIRNVLQIFVEALQKGSKTTAVAMVSVSGYLKSVRKVEEHLKEILNETTSEMQFMLMLLVPITGGIIVALAGLITSVLVQLAKFLSTVTGLSSQLPFSSPNLLATLVDPTKIVPIEWFTVIVGIYMIEIIFTLSVFISSLQYGSDQIEKYKLLTKGLFRGMIVFSLIAITVFFAFQGVVNIAP